MSKIKLNFKILGPAVILLAVLISSIVKINNSNKLRSKAELLELMNDSFLQKSVDEDAPMHYKLIEYQGLRANYETKWLVNTFTLDQNNKDVHIVAFNANGDSYRTSYSVTWCKEDTSKSLERFLQEKKKELLSQYRGTDIKTKVTTPGTIYSIGRKGLSFDCEAKLGAYKIYRRVTVFRENGYEFLIEQASDISHESLNTYFSDLESRISLDGIFR